MQQIWRKEILTWPLPQQSKLSRPADRSREPLGDEYPHHVWAIDFEFAAAADGHRLKFLNVIDGFSRVCLAIQVGRSCRDEDVIDTLEELLKLYPKQIHLRVENGPELIAHALQAWVHRQLYRNGVDPAGLTQGESIRGVVQWPNQG